MDVPLALHIDSGVVETLPPATNHLVLHGRSLRNTLGVLKRRLTHMKAKEIHTLQDVEHYKYVLDHLEQRWRDEEGAFLGALAKADAPLADACRSLWSTDYALVAAMEEDALEMPPDMRALHSRLADVHRRLQELTEREHTAAEVAAIVAELKEIDAGRQEHGGVFFGDIEAPPPGTAVCSELLSHGFELARAAAATAHDEPPELRTAADSLRRVRNELRKLAGQRHHAAEDTAHFRFLLMAVASAEAEYPNEWKGSEAEALVAECAAMVEALEASAEPMPPATAAAHKRLQALKRELSAAASRGGAPPRADVERWLDEANALDNERAAGGGVFGGVSGEGGVGAPPGQAVCHHLMDECYGLLQELMQR